MLTFVAKTLGFDPGEMMGIIPEFFDADDPRPAREQANENYGHAGGWRPQIGWTMRPDGSLEFFGQDGSDPHLPVLAEAKMRDEVLRYYPFSFFAIVQPDGTFEVSRLD